MSNTKWPHEAPSRPEPEAADYFPQGTETHLRDYWYIILKRRWMILAVVVCAVSYSAARAIMRKPVYSATSVLQIDRGKINLVQDVMTPDYWTGYNEFYPTQQRVLQSRNLARRVVRQLRLWEHPYFTGGQKLEPDEQTLENLSGAVVGMLQINQIRNTQLMELRFTSLDPQVSADLSNALAEQYISFSGESETTLARDTAGFIGEQVEKIQEEIQHREKLLQEYSQREDLVMVNEKELSIIRQLEELNSAHTQARASRANAEANFYSISADASGLPQVQSNPTIADLRTQRDLARRTVAELASKFKEDWPELKRARETLADLDRRLADEQQAVAKELVAQAQVEYRAALQRETLLLEEVESQKQQAQELSRLTSDYNQIKAEVDNQRSMLQQLLRRGTETGLSAALGERQPVNVRIVEAALVPRGPNGPGLSRNLFLGALVGIALALGMAFFLDYWETAIYTIEDLRRHVPLPYMGMVPRLEAASFALWAGSGMKAFAYDPNEGVNPRRGKSMNRTRSAHALSQTTKVASRAKEDTSMIAERFKFLRGSLLLSTPGAPPRTVLVTGPDKNAGKTFVACNLATSLADLGKKVLLIDADLRNPQLHKVFRFKNRVGLSNVLSGQTTIEKGCIVSTPIPNLYVLLAGPASPTPAELLGSTKMEETMAQCLEHFDYVLLDSAPLLPVFDSHYLTVRADANLLVVRSGHTSRHAVTQSLDLIDRVGGRVTGVVLNDVNLADYAQNYYYSYHSYEYGTYAEDPVERRAG
jgi:capsular exopolysaccharide synthesis family protein